MRPKRDGSVPNSLKPYSTLTANVSLAWVRVADQTPVVVPTRLCAAASGSAE